MRNKILKKTLGKLNSLFSISYGYQKKSFSQSGEDLIVDFIFNQLGYITPSFIDIGAHHPYLYNNTALFYQKGSRGINIEPDPNLYVLFNQERKSDINLNIGVSNEKNELDFYIMNVPTLNTFSKKEIERYQFEGNFSVREIKKVKVDTITNILCDYYDKKFPDFLSLDVEGMDDIIVKLINFDFYKPIVICIETISFSTTGNGVKNKELINYLFNINNYN